MNNNKTTVVSGYWSVKGKHTAESFQSWFGNTLRINCPYVFFGNQESIDLVKKVRHDLPTIYHQIEIHDFYTEKYRKHLAPHPIHVPSDDVCLIWLEKMILMEKAKDMNPYQSEFFVWVDAGICFYRNNPPPSQVFPHEGKLVDLPKDKFIFTSSEEPYEHHFVHKNNYYHHISGTAFMLYGDFISQFTKLYKIYLERNITYYNWVNTEQKIFTQMYADHPGLFFKLGKVYGTLMPLLY